MRWVLGCLVGEERKLKFFSSIIWLCRKWDKKNIYIFYPNKPMVYEFKDYALSV